MELAVVVAFVFTLCIVVMAVTIPVIIISRLMRLMRNSIAKLFTRKPRRA